MTQLPDDQPELNLPPTIAPAVEQAKETSGPSVRPRGHAFIAWIIIIIGCAVVIGSHFLETELTLGSAGGELPTAQPEDRLGVMIMELQSKYAVGAAAISGSSTAMYETLNETLNVGTIGQRQRFIVLAAELAGRDEAALKLRELDELIAQEQQKTKDGNDQTVLSLKQSLVQQVLRSLYGGAGDTSTLQNPLSQQTRQDFASEGMIIGEAVGADAEGKQVLVNELGWFGRLAFAHSGTADTTERETVLKPARSLAHLLIAITIIAFAAGILGFTGLVIVIVLAFSGTVRSAIKPGGGHHGIYAETFAAWLIFFFALNLGAGAAGFPDHAMLLAGLAFFASLGALAWPVIRGVPWNVVRQDIGWTFGQQPLLEPVFGVGGYFIALPLLAVGVVITYVLILIQQGFSTPGPIFGPSGGPAHPIIVEMAGTGWWAKIQVLFLAAVGAPVVEETMFRGVFYRHLRDATGKAGVVLSIVISGTISSLIFAAIHPQGWVAIPALMSLAFAFVILREWRGTIIPSMIVHGISNFLVMSMLILALRVSQLPASNNPQHTAASTAPQNQMENTLPNFPK